MKKRSTRSYIVVPFCAASLLACGGLFDALGRGSAGGNPCGPVPELVDSRDCPETSDSGCFSTVSAGKPPEWQVRMMACHTRYRHEVSPGEQPFVAHALNFDEGSPDPLVEAFIVIGCAGMDGSNDVSSERMCMAKINPAAVGQVAWYAAHVDPAAVKRALGKLSVSDELRAGFLTRAARR